jgi:hypothetical protein
MVLAQLPVLVRRASDSGARPIPDVNADPKQQRAPVENGSTFIRNLL